MTEGANFIDAEEEWRADVEYYTTPVPKKVSTNMSKCPKMSKVCIHKLMPVEKAVAIPTLPSNLGLNQGRKTSCLQRQRADHGAGAW